MVTANSAAQARDAVKTSTSNGALWRKPSCAQNSNAHRTACIHTKLHTYIWNLATYIDRWRART